MAEGPGEFLASSRLHVLPRAGVWALVRQGERSVMFANPDRDMVVRWAHDIAAAERGTVTVHES